MRTLLEYVVVRYQVAMFFAVLAILC